MIHHMDPPDSASSVAPAESVEPDDGVDVTLIRWMLSLSPAERLAVLQGFVDSVAELTRESPVPCTSLGPSRADIAPPSSNLL